MKPILAVSVIVATLCVLADTGSAQSPRPSLSERFDSFGSSVRDMAIKVGDKTKEVIKDLHESDLATKTRNWFSEKYQRVKQTFSKSD
ncbi:apolipoprotein C-I [Ascaphus truei]|uniref:apolipoprotein C-I n=1 Tax=Ascaphus truei TaxID=8439 RepID=UPI003F5A74A9